MHSLPNDSSSPLPSSPSSPSSSAPPPPPPLSSSPSSLPSSPSSSSCFIVDNEVGGESLSSPSCFDDLDHDLDHDDDDDFSNEYVVKRSPKFLMPVHKRRRNHKRNENLKNVMDPQIPHPDIGATARLDSLREQPFPAPPHMSHSTLDHWPSPPAAHAHHINSSGNIAGSIGSSSNHLVYPTSSLSPSKDAILPASSPNSNNGEERSNSNMRPNQVGTVILHGVAIVSLMIDNKERLCLAQISNTLLKDYSYNEIHNRRVALGITCVQCTPVQLEILRRAGAMPVSSRRCGMITKREAERLSKSFLEDNAPPKLPDDFAFDVFHECGWGCRGFFEPSRYNSSRAKCIKCSYCNMYFSPNKFIFHFHRSPGSKYNHPDAANFNSWRRHLRLCHEHDKEEINHKWEDVKAMFNGGTRKRILSSSSSPSSSASSSSSSAIFSSSSSSSSSRSNISPKFSSHSSSSHPTISSHHPSSFPRSAPHLDGASSAKKAKTSHLLEAAAATSFLPKPAPFTNPFNPYGWLATPHGKNPYPFMAMNSTQSMCFGFPPQLPSNKDALVDRMKAAAPVGIPPPASWMNRNPAAPLQFASMDLLWDKTFGFPPAAAVAALGFRNGGYPGPVIPSGAPPMSLESNDHHLSPSREDTASLSPNVSGPQNIMVASHERGEKHGDRMSAFTRVVPSMSSPSSSSLSPSNDDCRQHASPHSRGDNENEIDNIENDNDGSDNEEDRDEVTSPDMMSQREMEDMEEIDVEIDIDDKMKRRRDDDDDDHHHHHNDEDEDDDDDGDDNAREENKGKNATVEKPGFEESHKVITPPPASPSGKTTPTKSNPYADEISHGKIVPAQARHADAVGTSPASSHPHDLSIDGRQQRSPSPPLTAGRDSNVSDDSENERENPDTLLNLSKEELCETLKTEVESRRKKEEEVNVLKETFREEVTREKSFREHMAQQLEMLRETLTTELEQERKIRFSLQEKLKQAHDALNNFSCGLLTAGGEGVPFKDTKMIPR